MSISTLTRTDLGALEPGMSLAAIRSNRRVSGRAVTCPWTYAGGFTPTGTRMIISLRMSTS